jgi:hypothetical protein
MELAIRISIEHPLVIARHMAVANYHIVGDYGNTLVERRPSIPAETKENRTQDASI